MISKVQTSKHHIEFLDLWEQEMRSGLLTGRPFSQSTILIYWCYVADFLIQHGHLSVSTMKAALSNISPEHFAKREKLHRALICFGKLLIEEGALLETVLSPMLKLRPKQHFPPKRYVVNEQQVEKLLIHCHSTLDKLIVTFLVSTGLRASEACALNLTDIDFENGTLTIKRAKWGKSRRVGLTAMAIEALGNYLETSDRSENEVILFLNRDGRRMDRHGLNQRLQRIGKSAGIEVSPHALRRAFVTINANKGRPLPMLQIAAGHSDIATTRSYCMTTEEEAVNAMKTWN